MAVSASVIVEDEQSWVSLLEQMRRFKDEGDFPKAIYLAETCAARFAHDPDARGWALFNLFRLLLEYRSAESAVPLALELLRLNSNLPSKLHVVSVALDVFTRAGSLKRAAEIVQAVDDCIDRWLAGPVSPDDIAIGLATQVLQQCAAIGMAGGRNLRFAELAPQGEQVAHLPTRAFDRHEPFLSNAVPDKVARYQQGVMQHRGMNLVELHNVTLVRCGGLAVVFDDDDRILPVHYDAMPAFYVEPIRSLRKDVPAEIAVSGRSLSMMDDFNNGINFCHWMVDYVPRALLAVDEGIRFETLVGPSPLTADFQHRSLRDLLHERRYLSLDTGTAYRFETLVYADNFASNLNHPLYGGHPVLRDKLVRQFPVPSDARAKRPVYVPRKTSRRVINDQALWELLENRGFIRIDTDAMSLDEQVAAFRYASHVVAPHGAALTSTVFCEEGTDILELFPRFGGSAAFYVIATASGLRYSCYSDISHGQQPFDETFETYVNEAPIHADLTFVAEWLNVVGLGQPLSG